MTGFQTARPRPHPTLAQALELAQFWHTQAERNDANAATRFICWQEEGHWREIAHGLELQRQMSAVNA